MEDQVRQEWHLNHPSIDLKYLQVGVPGNSCRVGHPEDSQGYSCNDGSHLAVWGRLKKGLRKLRRDAGLRGHPKPA